MQKDGSYNRCELIIEQGFQRVTERIREVEKSKDISFDNFSDMVHLVEDETTYDFKVLGKLRSGLKREEEESGARSIMVNFLVCMQVVRAWVTFGRITGPDCYSKAALYLLTKVIMEFHLDMMKYGLGEGVRDDWEDELLRVGETLLVYGNIFGACFVYPSFFFVLEEKEKGQDLSFSLRESIKKTIRDYRNITKKIPGSSALIGEAISVEESTGGYFILDALVKRNPEGIRKAKVHLEKVRDFMLGKGESLRELKKVFMLRREGPSFPQILYFLKKRRKKIGDVQNSYSDTDENPVVTLPSCFDYYFSQLPSSEELLKEGRKIISVKFCLDCIPDSFEEIYERIQESLAIKTVKRDISFCESFYWQRLDYATIEKGFTNYIMVNYRIGKEEAVKVYELLKEYIGPEDVALSYAVADIVVSACIKKSEVNWETLRVIVVSGLIVKILKSLKKKKS